MSSPAVQPIVTPVELGSYLQATVNPEWAETAIRVASGHLQGATRMAEWPTPVPEPLWSWAIELAGIAYVNPTAMTEQQVGDERTIWYVARRREIVEAARTRYGGAGHPQWSFPPPEPWPR